MARPSANYNISTKTARARLAPRVKPYYREIGAGKSLGYIRREAGPGSWVAREWIGGKYVPRVFAVADDVGRADSRDVLSYDQALRIATAPTLPAPIRARLTVSVALDRYFLGLASRSDHAKEDRQRAEKHILPILSDVRVDRLTKTQLEAWKAGLVRDDPKDSDARRRSQDSANRVLTILKAALNAAFQDEANGIASDAAWRRVRPFQKVGRAREDHFDATAVRRLIAKAAVDDPSFAALVEAGFLTGARLGELTSANVEHLNAGKRSLQVAGKTGQRTITLSTEAANYLRECARGRLPDTPLLPRADGKRWCKSEQHRPMKRALALAELPASASYYALRHSYISRAIETGMPLSLLAENCGTSLMMIQKNYAKVLASTRRELVEATSPKLRRVK